MCVAHIFTQESNYDEKMESSDDDDPKHRIGNA
jgi:hypothetical protein